MEAYTGFAYVYDEYMDNIPYEEWEKYLYGLLKENNIGTDCTIADLGCGTGTVTRMLDKEGYDILGIDLSEDMLSIASEKTYEAEQQIIYSCQDMRDFTLPYTVDAFVSIGDSMNYITNNDDLCDVFKCVKNGLEDGGVFIFDLKTVHFSGIYLQIIPMLKIERSQHLYGTTTMMMRVQTMSMSLQYL